MPLICLEMQDIRIENHERAGADVIRDTYESMLQFSVPFLWRHCERIKELHFEKDGFGLLYKQLDNGCF